MLQTSMDNLAAVADFISASRIGHLGTADAHGRPLVLPFCYVFDGTALYSAIDGKPKRKPDDALGRVRNIRENPQVCVVIDHYEERWERLRHVIIHGRAEILRDGPEYGRAIEMLTAKYPQYRAMTLPKDGGVVIKVTPRRVTHWGATG